MNTSLVVFFSLLATMFLISFVGAGRSNNHSEDEDLAGRSLNKWLVGLSAGATGNSGFVVTGAVGLGYAGGLSALWLPIAWLIGDLIYWAIFPDKMNALARKTSTVTLSEYLSAGLSGRSAQILAIFVAFIIATLLTLYVSAQWIAGRKFLSSIFEFTDLTALLFFSITIILYSAAGGFRGSIWVDTFQAAVRLVGTVLALVFVCFSAVSLGDSFYLNIPNTETFFSLNFPGSTFAFFGFLSGFAFAAIGFGLGQPQIVSRFLACKSPAETKAARWIYISFLQFTWMSMTLFGVVLHGVMPELGGDAEKGLGLFFSSNFNAVVVGIIFADVYSTIAATSNSILISTAQIIRRDFLSKIVKNFNLAGKTPFYIVLILGIISIIISLPLKGASVFSVAIGAVSMLGASIAAPMLIKTLQLRHSAGSLIFAVASGLVSAVLWKYTLTLSSIFNEAGVGIIMGIIANYLYVALRKL